MVDFDKFLSWAESRFDDVVVQGQEIRLNSIFHDGDTKHRLWCSPSGGKKKREGGVYHCFRSDERGTLVGLVMKVDSCTYDEALDFLGGADITLRELESKVDEFFDDLQTKPEVPVEIKLAIPPQTYFLKDLPEDDYFRSAAEIYLTERKLSLDDKMVCCGGDYVNRIVIPYYDQDGKLIYFNARYIGKRKDMPKYRGPEKSVGVGKGDVIYMPQWPEEETDLFVTEGEFDAESLVQAELAAAAVGGKSASPYQIGVLKYHRPILAFDRDSAGIGAILDIAEKLQFGPRVDIRYVLPPKNCKDWNDMLIKHGPDILNVYVKKSTKLLDDNAIHRLGE